jgi:LDH2 family malate/lactate/ureidoglycolate dehydrogenase
MPVVTAGQEGGLIEAALARLGVPAAEGHVQATALVEADLRGHASHGLRRLPTLAARITSGVVVPGAVTTLDWVTGAVLRADGHGGLGPVVAGRAAAALTERVRRTGVAVAAIRGANHLGILAPYVEQLSRQGLTVLMTTSSEALVHASHGNKAIVGTNPLAIGIPAPGNPVVLDMATGLVSMGKIIDYAARGEPLPAGWAVDAAGQPTTDAAAAARGGAIAPFGGGKGYGLGLSLELLVAILTGTALGTAVRGTLDTDQPATKGDLIIAFDTGQFGDLAVIGGRVAAYLDEVRGTAAPGEAVLIPGDRARADRARRLAGGIEIPDELWATVADLAGTRPSP